MKASLNAIDLIKRFEGLILTAKNHGDSNTDRPLYTIGYGHTKSTYKDMKISLIQAENLLLQDIEDAERDVSLLVKVPLNQNQFDALVSFVFNVGFSQFASSTLLKVINTGDYNSACFQFQRWVYDNGKTLNGLVSRRAAECELFSRSVNVTPIDSPDNQTRIPKYVRKITPAPLRVERDNLKESRTIKAGAGVVSTGFFGYISHKFNSVMSWLPHYADDVLFVTAFVLVLYMMWCRRDDFLGSKK